jgi:hypothetical protein
MLEELLVLNEEMIEQLRFERMDSAGTTAFITGMIEQHEMVASKLRAQLRNHQTAHAVHKPLTRQYQL